MKLKTLRLIIISLISCFLVSLPLVTSELLAQNPNLILSQSSLIEKVPELGTPNDPLYPKQWHLYGDFGTNWDRLLDYRMYHQYGKGVVVAIIDTGIDFDSEFDLNSDSFIEGYDVVAKENIDNVDESIDLDGHGTLMASAIAQASWNGKGAVGIAPNAKMMPIRVADSGNNIDLVNVTKGIRKATEMGADIINISIAPTQIEIEKKTGLLSHFPNKQARKEAIEDFKKSIEEAYKKNIVIILASGNHSSEYQIDDVMAELFDSNTVIMVSAHNSNGKLSSYSPEDKIKGFDISAPGGEKNLDPIITSSGQFSGSSMAAAQVSGTAAVVIGTFKNCQSWRDVNQPSLKNGLERKPLLISVQCRQPSTEDVYQILTNPGHILRRVYRYSCRSTAEEKRIHETINKEILANRYITSQDSPDVNISRLNILASELASYEYIRNPQKIKSMPNKVIIKNDDSDVKLLGMKSPQSILFSLIFSALGLGAYYMIVKHKKS